VPNLLREEVLLETPNVTVPFPVPFAPEVMLIQEALLFADQLKFEQAIVTIKLPDPPAAGNDALVGAIEVVQGQVGA
jgi:hypothetical protein